MARELYYQWIPPELKAQMAEHPQPIIEGFTGATNHNHQLRKTFGPLPTAESLNKTALHSSQNYYSQYGLHRQGFSKSDTDTLADSQWVRICMNAITDYIGGLPWGIYDDDDDSQDNAIDFLKHPNPDQSFRTVTTEWLTDGLKYDAGVLVNAFGGDGKHIKEIKAYLGTEFWIEPIVSDGSMHGQIGRYWQHSTAGYIIPFEPKEIVYYKQYPRTQSFYGVSVLQWLVDSLSFLDDSTRFTSKYFENGMFPGMQIDHPDLRGETQLRARMEYYKSEYQGRDKTNTPLVTGGDTKITPLTWSNSDMQWLDSQKWFVMGVLASYGFNANEFGLDNNVNRATSHVQKNIAKNKAVYSRVIEMEENINLKILPYLEGYQPDWRFEFERVMDLEDEKLKADTNHVKAQSAKLLADSGLPWDIIAKEVDYNTELFTEFEIQEPQYEA